MKELEKSQEIQNLSEIGFLLNKSLKRSSAKLLPNPSLKLGNKNFVEKFKEVNFQLYNQPIFSVKHDLNVAIFHRKTINIGQMVN